MEQDSAPVEDVAAGWWEYQRLFRGGRAERKSLELGEPATAVAAVERVAECMRTGGVEAVAAVVALVHGAVTDDDLALVGAGPFEDLLVAHGIHLAERVEEVARREPRFAAALGTVCWWPTDQATAQRLGRWLSGTETRSDGD